VTENLEMAAGVEMAAGEGEVTGVQKREEATDEEMTGVAGGVEAILHEENLQVVRPDVESDVVTTTAVDLRVVVATVIARDLQLGEIEDDEVVPVALLDGRVEAGLLTGEGEVVLRSEGGDETVADVEAAVPAVRPKGVLAVGTGVLQDVGIIALAAAAAVEVPQPEAGVEGGEGSTTRAQSYTGLAMRLNSRNTVVVGDGQNGSTQKWINFTEVVCTVS